jgi:hypothetical protein
VNDYVRSLLRFWWVLVIGLAVAQVAAIMAVYNVDFSSIPPSLHQRQKPSYSAQGRLLVTDADEPHLRTSITSEQAVPPTATGARASIPVTSAPDTATLVQAANLYPVLIESDQVAELRRKLYGPTPGVLRAQALYAVSSPSKFTPSRVPVIQLIAVADSPKRAIELVQRTSTAFVRWMTLTQGQRGIRPKQRITVMPIQTPKAAASFGGSSSTLPVLVFGVVLMAVVALALFFDRLFPRPRASLATSEEPAREPARISA